MPSLPCVVAFSLVDLKTFGPLALRSSPFYLVHPCEAQLSNFSNDFETRIRGRNYDVKGVRSVGSCGGRLMAKQTRTAPTPPQRPHIACRQSQTTSAKKKPKRRTGSATALCPKPLRAR